MVISPSNYGPVDDSFQALTAFISAGRPDRGRKLPVHTGDFFTADNTVSSLLKAGSDKTILNSLANRSMSLSSVNGTCIL